MKMKVPFFKITQVTCGFWESLGVFGGATPLYPAHTP